MKEDKDQNLERLLYSLSSLVELSETMTSPESFVENSRAILHQVLGTLLVSRGALFIIDDETDVLKLYVSKGIDKQDIDLHLKTDEKASLLKISDPVEVSKIPIKRIKEQIINTMPEATLWISLKIKDELLGVIILGKKFMDEELTPQDIDLLKIISRSVAVTIYNYRLIANLNDKIEELKNRESELRKRTLELEVLYDVGLEVTFLAESIEEITHQILTNAVGLLDARAGVLFLIDQESKEIYPSVSINIEGSEILKLNRNFSAIKYAIEHKAGSIRSPGQPTEDEPLANSEILTVPILYQNKVIGIFMLIDKEGREANINFDEGDKKLLAAFANQAAIAIENSRLYMVSLEKERMQRDIELAAEIQRELIPERFPEYRGLDIDGFCIPCRTVGGDYYNYFRISDDKLLLVVADVSGKGIPAALLVSSLNSVLIVELELETDLQKIVGALSRSIFYSSTSGKFATAFFAEIDLKNSTVRYINAGHNPPLFLTSSGERPELMNGGFCIGMFEDVKYETGELPFRKGELLSIYTDGITEQMNDNEEFFEEERLFDIILANKNKSSHTINRKVIKEIHSFSRNTPIADDMTLLTIKRI